MNRILMADSYKASQWKQYPKGTTSVFSYFESRGSEREYKETVFFGLQYLLKKYLSTPITAEEIEEAKELIEAHGEPFNYEGWKGLVEKHEGRLPLRIRSVPEGTVTENHNALFTVENTDPEFYWLSNYFETILCRAGWFGTTVATQSYYLRKLIYQYLKETSDNPDAEIDFKLHDFGARGVSSEESAQIGGMAHLLSFKGTDTMSAIWAAKKYYNAFMAGFSIPAMEHSTVSSWGRGREVDAYRNMLQTYGGKGKLLACVSDTWDIFNACENLWGKELRQEVIDSGATVIIRPDSGDPKTVVLKCLHILEDKFGAMQNYKGYKVLNHVRLIQGDGVNPDSIKEILEAMKEAKFSATNIAFGMGGALLQKVNRDTLKFAYKCSSITVDGKVTDVYKDPVTDIGKRSKAGRLDLVKSYGYPFGTVRLADSQVSHDKSVMRTVWENGELLVDESLEEIRERIFPTPF